jgi:hypothetical protein
MNNNEKLFLASFMTMLNYCLYGVYNRIVRQDWLMWVNIILLIVSLLMLLGFMFSVAKNGPKNIVHAIKWLVFNLVINLSFFFLYWV